MFDLRILFATVTTCIVCPVCHDSCNVKEYEQKGFCCPMCEPGQYVLEHCTEQTGTECQPCANKTYQDRFNGDENCKTCKHCGEGTFQIKECMMKYDTVCDCLEGFHCDNITHDGCEQCTKHSTCPPGEVVAIKGAYRRDTVCRPQPNGNNLSEETSTKPAKEVTEDSENWLIGCTLVIIPVCVVIVILLTWKRKYIINHFCQAIGHCSKETDKNHSVETDLQQPVQEQGNRDNLAVSVEESPHIRPYHDIADSKQLNGATLNEKVRMCEKQHVDLGEVIQMKSSVEVIDW
ncbi:tumor necrosis factor receptor superfamily member 5-like [Heterodontus francisci]|uniref:tumor necrosis factor receptor superfamily member 5-like n=1 Tax=Heterodontus francisci TaxID=7792 RepID=UPI00355B13C8